MPEQANVLVVAHQTAATAPLLDAVRERVQRGPARFHLVVPSRPHGLDKVMDPQEHGQEEARRVLADALPKLSAGHRGGNANDPGIVSRFRQTTSPT